MKLRLTLEQARALGLVSQAQIDAARSAQRRAEVSDHVQAQRDATDARRLDARRRRTAAHPTNQGKPT